MSQSNDNQIPDDQFIQESVKKSYDQVPEAPLSKEVMWQRINAELVEQSPKRLSRFINKKMVSIASVFTILIISSLFFHIKDGEAFGWFTDYFVEKNGSTTQITNQLSDKPIDTNEDIPPVPSEDDLSSEELIPIKESMNFTEAKERVSFALLKPNWIPEDYTLNGVTVITFDHHPQEEAILAYQSGESEFTIRQTPIIGEQFGSNTNSYNESTNVVTVEINGSKATYLGFNDGTAQLIWMRMRMLISIEGPLSESEMIEIASSL